MFEDLSPPYSTIVVDPPWEYSEGWPPWAMSGQDDRPRTPLPYASMTLEAIAELPVASLSKLDGYLFLWTTNRYLEDAYRIVRGWRYTPRQTLVWCKPPNGVGPGGMFATTTEFVVVAQRCGPKSHPRGVRTNGQRMDTSWWEWPRGRHSSKPPQFMDLVETVSPGPYLELFARERRLGWDAWGNEV